MRAAVGLLLALLATAVRSEPLIVFAAASTRNALDEVAKAYTSRMADAVTISYGGSSALARQIEQGAPADVFVSADLEWMDYLQNRGLIDRDTRMNLLRNRLVLIATADSQAKLQIRPAFPLAVTLGKERLAMADPDSVPAGRYGKAALEKLGVWKDVRTRIAAAADVRTALLLVARGEAPFGIVYMTDAAVEKRVRVLDTFPEDTHPPIVYPAALTRHGRSATGERFLKALREPSARAVFERYGFR